MQSNQFALPYSAYKSTSQHYCALRTRSSVCTTLHCIQDNAGWLASCQSIIQACPHATYNFEATMHSARELKVKPVFLLATHSCNNAAKQLSFVKPWRLIEASLCSYDTTTNMAWHNCMWAQCMRYAGVKPDTNLESIKRHKFSVRWTNEYNTWNWLWYLLEKENKNKAALEKA